MTDYEKSDGGKVKVVEEIIYKLQQVSKSESELAKSIKQLVVLSRLRKLEVKIEQKVKDMPITYDIKTDGLYNQGIMEGIQKGREKEREKNRFQMISKALSQRVLTIEQIAEIAEVSIDYVLSVQSELERKRDT